jgi:uncharacterized protein YndB with AHSA1/START domain
MRHFILALALAIVGSTAARAEVLSSSPIHFDIQSRVTVAAPPAEAYAALGEVGRWWEDSHTYSGAAANMRIDQWAGGCFCETLPDGGTVEHMRVIQALPGRVLRMSGGLGPLQEEALIGTLTWTLSAVPEGTEIVSRYLVSGHVRGDTGDLAPLVDQVLRAQFERLKAHLAR